MKLKKLTALALACTMFATSLPMGGPVLASSGDASGDGITITQQTSTPVIQIQDDGITVAPADEPDHAQETVPATETPDAVPATGTDPGGMDETPQAPASASAAVNPDAGDLPAASVGDTTVYTAGGMAGVTLAAENPTEEALQLRLYLWDWAGELPEDSEAYTDPCEDAAFMGLDETGSLPVSLSASDGTMVSAMASLGTETSEDGAVTARYLAFDLPAGTSAQMDLMLSCAAADRIALVPVLVGADDVPQAQPALSIQWIETPGIATDDIFTVTDTAEAPALLGSADGAYVVTEEEDEELMTFDEWYASISDEMRAIVDSYAGTEGSSNESLGIATMSVESRSSFNATVTWDGDVRYFSWSGKIFGVTNTVNGKHNVAYCGNASKESTQGTYPAQEYVNDRVKAAILTSKWGGYEVEPDVPGSVWYGVGGTQPEHVYALTHAVISFLYANDTKGFNISQSDARWQLLFVQVPQRIDNWIATHRDVLDRYTLYRICPGGAYQDLLWVEPSNGTLKLSKVSSNMDLFNGNNTFWTNCYSYEGAVYGVYNSDWEAYMNINAVGTLTTDWLGNSNELTLGSGTYYVKEISASPGFDLDPNTYPVTVTSGQTATVTSYEPPKNDPVGIRITKIQNGEATSTIPSLEGTRFTVRFYAGYYDRNTLPATPTRTWVIEVKEVNGSYITGLTESYLVKELSDPLFKDNSGNNVALPLGTVTIQETTPAPGYTLDGYLKDPNGNVIATNSELYISQVIANDSVVHLAGGNTFTAEDTPRPTNLQIRKLDPNGNPRSGVTYELKNSKGQVVTTATTDGSGIARFNNLYPDVYTITETNTPDGLQLLKDPITVQVPLRVTEQQIVENGIDRSKCVYDPYENIYYIFDLTYEVNNDVILEMPVTGMTDPLWTWMPLLAGGVLFVGTALAVIRKKRRNA